jgi:hypothetical protein
MSTLLTHWAEASLALALAVAVGRAFGGSFGPLLAPRFPRAWPALCAFARLLAALLPDVLAALAKRPPAPPAAEPGPPARLYTLRPPPLDPTDTE